MDERSIRFYDQITGDIAARYRSIDPSLLPYLTMAANFFYAGQPTADIGCGVGRDAAWLQGQGFPVVGYDASSGMLEQARSAYPGLEVRQATLPDLAVIPDESYANVQCAATLMHVHRESIITAVLNLARILRPRGRLLLSFRASRSAGEREPDGRLFTFIHPGKMILLLESAGLRVVTAVDQPDESRPDVLWHLLLAEKSPLNVARGLDRIQSVLVQDRKTATYKLALLRGLCDISRAESHLVVWGDDEVYVPLWSLAIRWLVYYWPLINAPRFIAQLRGERPGSSKTISFRKTLQQLAETFSPSGLYAVLKAIEERPLQYRSHLQTIANAIRVGPVVFAGTGGPSLFEYRRHVGAGRSPAGLESMFGYVVVPQAIWLDISRFDHWITDSVIVRWARLTAELNHSATMEEYVPLLLSNPAAERDTQEVRDLLRSLGQPVECVWSGRRLATAADLQVDHIIPYSAWGNNDLWNLLPSSKRLNLSKSDQLPTQRLLLECRDTIIHYWQIYRQHWEARFDTQVSRALEYAASGCGWESRAFAGLQETVERIATSRGLARWEPR